MGLKAPVALRVKRTLRGLLGLMALGAFGFKSLVYRGYIMVYVCVVVASGLCLVVFFTTEITEIHRDFFVG